MSAREERFIQPDNGVVVVSRASEDVILARARARIAAGEDLARVVDESAIEAVMEEMTKEEIRGAAAFRPEGPLHRAADAHLQIMTLALRAAFNVARKALGKNANVDAAVSALKAALLKVLPSVFLKTMVAGGEAGLGMLQGQLKAAEFRALKPSIIKPAKPKLTMRFDVTNPAAIAWAKAHAAELAKDLSATSEQNIKDAVARATEEGDLDALYDDILAAVGDEARADMIARTEVMAAANTGNRLAWDQAVDEGLLTGNERVEWIATSDACSEICEPLGRNDTSS